MILYGAVGTDKTNLATAIGVEAYNQSQKVKFYRTAALLKGYPFEVSLLFIFDFEDLLSSSSNRNTYTLPLLEANIQISTGN